MRSIWKFPHVKIDDTTEVEVAGAHLVSWVHAEATGRPGYLTLWGEVVRRDDDYTEVAKFLVRGTGHAFTGREGEHFVTVRDSSYYWHLFQYLPQTFYMAECKNCEMPMPFATEAGREMWAQKHQQGTGHEVTVLGTEVK